MATLYIAEFSAGGSPAGEAVATEALSVQTPLTISGTTNPSAAFGGDTKIVRLFADAACSVVFGTSPTATVAAGIPIGAEQPEYFAISAGHKVAVISR